MYYLEVSPIKIIRKDASSFTYHHDKLLPIGSIVKIPVGKSQCIGIVTGIAGKPGFATKQITKIIQDEPIPLELIQTAKWMSEYYYAHLSQCLALLIPSGIEKSRRQRNIQSYQPVRQRSTYQLTPYQTNAIKKITQSNSTTNILFGVTGSGKTRVYSELIKTNLKQGMSSIVLVPEISLTSQLVDEFTQIFGDDIITTHSHQTESERHIAWKRVIKSATPKVIIGPRSALFLPLKNVGTIIVDEFHEPSYKQDKQPRYSSLRVATILGKYHNAKVVLGSATPSVVEMYIAKKTSSLIVEMPTTAISVIKPKITVVDMTKRNNFTTHKFLSDALITSIRESLSLNKQALIFHNRRGTAPITLCSNCGWTAIDPFSATPLTLHADKYILINHLTGSTYPVPTCCPICNKADIIHKGIGTKLLESELRRLFPKANIARFDGDNKKEDSVEQRYKELYQAKINIIIGTQIIAKGIDLPKLNSVGIVQADANLALPDFSSEERVFQLITQVIGRVGRHSDNTEVIIQSYQPNQTAIKTAIAQDYNSFYNHTITQRKNNNFPPFSYLLRIVCSYKTEAAAIKNTTKLLSELKTISANSGITLLGPAPSFYEKSGEYYRWQIIAKSPRRQDLLDLIPHIPSQYWQYYIDPISLL